MARSAFLGLGQMGTPMAMRLVEAGHTVVVWNRTAARAAPFAARGVPVAPTPATAARSAEIAITMLADPEALGAVVNGPDGLAAGLESASTLVEMSTVGPRAVNQIAARLMPRGCHVVDAPVLGSVPQAVDGTLSIFAGGDPLDYERVREVLGHMGRPRHFGPLGTGAALKLVVNSTLGSLMSVLGEALSLADGLGVDTAAALDVLVESPIGVTARSKRSHIESGSYPPRFKLALAVKDLRLVEEAAQATGRELRLVREARVWFEAAATGGAGELDYSAVVARIRGVPATGRAS